MKQVSDTRTTEASEEKLPPDRERSVIQLDVSPPYGRLFVQLMARGSGKH